MKFFDPLFEQLTTLWVGFVQSLPLIGLGIIVLIMTWIAAMIARRAVRAAVSKAKMRRALIDLFQTLVGIFVWILGIFIAAAIVFPSVTPAQLIGALGIGGIAVGLAFKDIFENFMAGIMIMIRKPMSIGDVIEVDGVQGRVEEITIRDTYLRQLSGELVLLPNSLLFTNAVDIKTDRPKRRYDLVVGVAYDEDAAAARDVIQKAVEGLDDIDTDKGVEVYAREFGASSIDYTVRWWAGSAPKEMHKTRSSVVIAIKKALDDAGIEIPYPYRTLTFKEPLPLIRGGTEATDENA
ncbi:MAG: mechanosensitive ion channel protein MscS [Maricaulis sp.]|jgi:small-conductance mechanosensitive channel|nr:mechanosensitive ion channel protein MscS [Maricaulis sp.]